MFCVAQRSIAYISSFNPQNDPAGGDCGYSGFTLEEVRAQNGQDLALGHPAVQGWELV